MAAEKCYIASLIILSLLCIGLLAGVLYLGLHKQKTTPIDDSVCITKDCSLTASLLISAMDTSVKPCEDFYQFSCGNFIKKNPVKPDEISFSVDDLFQKNVELQLSQLIEELNSYGEPNVVFRLQEAYHVCINTTYQREKEFKAFKNFTKNVLDWPLMSGENWKPRRKILSDYVSLFEEMGIYNPLVTIEADVTDEDPAKYVIKLSPATFYSFWFRGSVVQETDEQKVLKLTKEMLLKILHLLGNDDQDSIDSELQLVVDLVKYLITNQAVDENDNNNNEKKNNDEEHEGEDSNEDDENVMTFAELFDMTQQKFDWLAIANSRLHQKAFDSSDEVYVENLHYIRNLGNAARKFPMRTFLNMFGLEILMESVLKHASPEIDSILKEYISAVELYNVQALIGKEFRDKPRWLYCLETTTETFNLVLTRLFIKKYIDTDEKQSADKMIQLIQNAYKKDIESSDWLDDETKQAALVKANKIKRFVGYPDVIFDDAALDKLYENTLPQVKPTHLENYLMCLAAKSEKNIPFSGDSAREEIYMWKWESSPLVVNAFYLGIRNSIWFPYAHLQLPYFQDNRLAAVNFGMMGSVIGHELGHAFDNDGSTLDGDGKERDWWTIDTKNKFSLKLKCFIDQYSNFCPKELQGDENDGKICVNGEQTVGENSADNSGLDAAYLAYKLWVEEHGAEKRLPGLSEFTGQQIFFISFGYNWCENIPPHNWLNRYEADSHSPARYRVLGAVANSKYFRDAFSCSEGPMNRGKDSCTVW